MNCLSKFLGFAHYARGIRVDDLCVQLVTNVQLVADYLGNFLASSTELGQRGDIAKEVTGEAEHAIRLCALAIQPSVT